MTKADGISIDINSHELYLTAEGEEVGKRISIEDIGDSIVATSDEGLVTVII